MNDAADTRGPQGSQAPYALRSPAGDESILPAATPASGDAAAAPVPIDGGLWLGRGPDGRLLLTDAEGAVHAGVVPVRAFPLAAPGEGLSLVGAEGRELAWIDRLDSLPPAARTLVEAALAPRDFAPTIVRLDAVSGFATPSVWSVETDRGPTRFTLRAEDDIRRLQGNTLLILGEGGLQFRIADRFALDKGSRRLLERFL
jgi:hypothetical protein